MADEQSTEWTADGDEWSRKLGGLDLQVWPDPDDPDEPWGYEVVLAEDDDGEYEIASGGAADLEAAKAVAEAAAVTYENEEADDDEEDDDEE